MTLEGANNFFENNDFILYAMNSAQTGQYCVVVPKNLGNAVSMLVDINMKTLFDSLMSNTITKEQLVEKIEEEYKFVNNSYAGSILVLPMLDMNVLSSAVNSGDKQRMFDETKKIGGITSELYRKLTESGVDKSGVSQKIIIVENSEIDIRFVEWLKVQMPNFVDGVSLSELKSKSSTPVNDVNPFANVNPFTSEPEVASTVEPIAPVTNDIFGVSPANNVDAPLGEQKTNDTFGIFDSQPAVQSEIAPVAPTIEPAAPVNNVNPFEPQPVQSVSLNNEPVNNQVPNEQVVATEVPVQNQPVTELPTTNEEGDEVNELDKKSGGFANLLILVVILVGVTFVSIELGKYLYSIFGA